MERWFLLFEAIYGLLGIGTLAFILWVLNFVFMPSVREALSKLANRNARFVPPSKAELLIHALLTETREVREGLRIPVSING